MEKNRSVGFTVFLLIMVLIALLGLVMLIYGSAAHESLPSATPWTVAQGLRHG